MGQAAAPHPLNQDGDSQLFMSFLDLDFALHRPILAHMVVHQMATTQIINLYWVCFICFLSTVSPVTSLETRAERLERRRQHPAYKRAMSNLHLQFIAEFMKEKPPTDPTVRDKAWDFDPSGLGDESHWSLLWWLPGIVLTISALALYVALGKASTLKYNRPSAQHINLDNII